MTFFPDQQFLGKDADLFPFDVRFDPADAAFLSWTDDQRLRFRIVTDPAFAEAHLVAADGAGTAMDLVAESSSLQVWEANHEAHDGLRFTFALRTKAGRPVYRVPAGVANAVERLDRWSLDLGAVRRTATPQWSRGMVVYQIFPDRFRNGDPSLDPADVVPWGSEPRWLDFQGGDLRGIAERADHLAGLGVDCVYVNPIFASPSTHRYDAFDYHNVDPALGGNEALAALVDALHRHGIKLIVDVSFNHCHPRFFAFSDLLERGAASPYADWFIVERWPIQVSVRPGRLAAAHHDEAYGTYLRRFAAESGVPVVELDDDGRSPVECSYDTWYGVPSLPRINLANPDARRYFLEVAVRWVRDFGIDGWRMDVARYVDFDFWPEFRDVVKAARPEAYLIAEIFGSAGPWLQGDTFDATMNYTFRALAVEFFATREIDGADLADGIVRMHAACSPEVTQSNQNLLGSHDTARFLHHAGGHPDRLHLATIFQLTMPGAPGLYYGDEVGMSGGEEPGSRGAFPWHDEASWDREQLRIVRELGALRRSHPALRTGSYRGRWHSTDAIAFTRALGDRELLVVINRGDDPAEPSLPAPIRAAAPVWGHGTPRSVPPRSALIAEV